jgi:hypothetical protein
MWQAMALGGAGLGMQMLGAYQQNKWSREAAREQMAFQERMSSTAHQREVADLKAAGLNPILSAHKGASSPVGATFSANNVAEGAASSAQGAGRLAADLKILKQKARSAEAQAEVDSVKAEAAKGLKSAVDQSKRGWSMIKQLFMNNGAFDTSAVRRH